jgi:uncharacterized tellurite resistance protein B-like protein
MAEALLEKLKLALTLQAARMIVHADDEVSPAETTALRRFFPPDRLEKAGFVNPETGHLNRAYTEARLAAVEVLPEKLSLAEKQDIVMTLHEICLSDGQVDPRESEVIRQVADLLGLNRR